MFHLRLRLQYVIAFSMSPLGSGCHFEVQVNDTVQYFKITTNIDVLLLTLSCLGSVFYDLASATIMSGIHSLEFILKSSACFQEGY